MFQNHLYNLMEQLAQEHKSLWRIKNHYIADSSGHPDCIAFWESLEKEKETHIKDLTELIKTHLR